MGGPPSGNGSRPKVTEVEAIARAAATHEADVWMMAPMVATVEETRDFVAMVEVPAAALSAREILAAARFASIWHERPRAVRARRRPPRRRARRPARPLGSRRSCAWWPRAWRRGARWRGEAPPGARSRSAV